MPADLDTAAAARLAGVQPGTIRKWRSLGYLGTQGLDGRGYPMHTAEAVRAAEKKARESGLRSVTGTDPRRMRGRPAPARKPRKLPAMPASVTDDGTARMCAATGHCCPACATAAAGLGAAAGEARTAILAAAGGGASFELAMRKLASLGTALDEWEKIAAEHAAAAAGWQDQDETEAS